MNCPYCELPELKTRTIIKNRSAWVFPTNIPIVPGHLLIAPIRCVSTFEKLTSDEVEDIFDLKKKLKPALIKSFGAEGFNYAWNEGALAGQSIPHFHLHMLPRRTGDEGITEYEPRKFLYRPGSREKTPEEELARIADLIRSSIE